jgi:hypothetical protein
MVSMSRADLAFWSVVRHVNKKAAHYAPDDTVHRAYEVVTDHAEERFEYFRRAENVARPPTPPKPKSA